MSEKRYYVSENEDSIVEYPAELIHTPQKTYANDKNTSTSEGTNVLMHVQPEYEVAHLHHMFRLHPTMAEIVIAKWQSDQFIDHYVGDVSE
jgi:hypothetical protein